MSALSLFSGCGGDTLGMKNAGLDVKWYSEINPSFQKTHEANFPNSKCIGGDITKIPNEKFKELKGKVKVIFAGFPCQSFSHAGKKRADDTRGQLYLDFVRATKNIEPDFIIGENVKGLLSRKTSTGENFIDVIEKAFKDIGYTCEYKLFPVVKYGVPQQRERLIIVGWKDPNYVHKWPDELDVDVSLKNILEFNMEGTIKVPKELITKAGVKEESILKGDVTHEQSDAKSRKLAMEAVNSPDPATYKALLKQAINALDDSVHPYLIDRVKQRDLEYNGKKVGKYGFSFGKRVSPIHCEIVDITMPSKTIISTYDHQPRLFVAQKVKDAYYLRPYTVDELKQIQGFPKDYVMQGSWKDQVVQLGNAVPPPLIQRIVESISP
jgi:DNA (cytosine-5)-methyltransferase 1